jgi:hypothetical protein
LLRSSVFQAKNLSPYSGHMRYALRVAMQEKKFNAAPSPILVPSIRAVSHIPSPDATATARLTVLDLSI